MEKENNASETKKWPPTKNLFAQPQKFLADGQMNELRQSGEKVFVQSEKLLSNMKYFEVWFGLLR